MNYIAEINAFYNWLDFNSISGNTQALWHKLMSLNNRCGWISSFSVANTTLVSALGISRQELDRVRNVLIQKGRIIYKKGTGSQCGFYTIIPFVSHNVTQDITQDITQSGHNCLPLNKLNETKQNKTNNSCAKEVNTLFECVWELYPVKRGKNDVKKTQREKLFKIGYDELKRAIDRYVSEQQIKGTELKYYKQGSTFFNGAYIDYLDKNFKPLSQDNAQSEVKYLD